MSVLVVTGTGTEVGKTIVTAAIAALAQHAKLRVAVIKPAQTGVSGTDAGDIDEIMRLVPGVTGVELVRYPDPLAPRTAARRAARQPISIDATVNAIKDLDATHDLVLVEGAGGVLVQFDEEANTIADIAKHLQSDVLVVTSATLGTLNMTALTTEALQHRSCRCIGLVIGRWPSEPDLAARCNVEDLPTVSGAPLLGVLPDNLDLDPATFSDRVRNYLGPTLGGDFNLANFVSK